MSCFLIFAGTAVLSTMALFTRQSLFVAYIALGAILGPWGLKLIIILRLLLKQAILALSFFYFC